MLRGAVVRFGVCSRGVFNLLIVGVTRWKGSVAAWPVVGAVDVVTSFSAFPGQSHWQALSAPACGDHPVPESACSPLPSISLSTFLLLAPACLPVGTPLCWAPWVDLLGGLLRATGAVLGAPDSASASSCAGGWPPAALQGFPPPTPHAPQGPLEPKGCHLRHSCWLSC